MPLQVCVAGVGAIGGSVAAGLMATDAVLTVLARPDSCRLIRQNGLVIRGAEEDQLFVPHVVDTVRDLHEQDIVFIATKGHALQELAPFIAPIIGPDTLIIPLLNGVPWWFFAHLGAAAPLSLPSVDPDGIVSQHLPPDQVIGAVLHLSAASPAPGIVVRGLGNEIILGDPLRRDASRTAPIARLLTDAGFLVHESDNIHHDVWYKLWGNISFNPISALTRATTDVIAEDPDTRALCAAVMRETANVSEHFGVEIDASVDRRIAYAGELGRFKTSMLQDVEAGRRLEIGPILNAVVEIADGIPLEVPNIRALLGLTRLLDRSLASAGG